MNSDVLLSDNRQVIENPVLRKVWWKNLRLRFYISLFSLMMLVIGQLVYTLFVHSTNVFPLLALQLLVIGNALLVVQLFNKDWLSPIRQLNEKARNLSKNEHAHSETHVLDELDEQLDVLSNQMNEATLFAHNIGSGKYDSQLNSLYLHDGLGKALTDMRLQLQQMADEESRRNWTVNGIAQFSELLREHQQSSITDMSDAYIRNLVRYLKANQGSIYLLNDEQPHAPFIELISSFAYDKKKYEQKTLEVGQGLVGQCMRENEHIYMTKVPAGYVKITSGLGEATPRNILLVPVKANGKTHGVIEIASFYQIEKHHIQFIESIAEGFASMITGLKINMHTQGLLAESRNIAMELRDKEEVLRQNTEELVATQEELARKVIEVEKESALISSIVDAINKTNASLELDMNGVIIGVNDMYLSLMEYTREELIGVSEKSLAAAEEINSERYDMMWNSILNGAFNSGEYRRVSKSGKELWLTGTYSPIYDIEGKAYKIIQFAQFTTEQKEKELELSTKINAINQCVPLIEVNLQGVIITANSFFMSEFGFKRTDIRNKDLTSLLDPTFAASRDYSDIWDSIRRGDIITRSMKFRTKTDEDRYFISNFSPSKNLAGQVHKILLALIDITEQQQLKDRLKLMLTEEKRKNAILELQAETTDEFVDKLGDIVLELEESTDQVAMDNLLRDKKIPVIEMDQKGIIVFVNNGIEKILGTEELALIGADIHSFLHFNNQEEEIYFDNKIRTPSLSQLKLKFKVKQDQIMMFNIFITPRFNFVEEQDFFTMLILLMNVEPSLDN